MTTAPLMLSNFRREDSIENWPIGRDKRATAIFAHEATKRGQRILRTTTGKPKATTYYKAICLADGSDGKTHLVSLAAEIDMLRVGSADMKHAEKTLWPRDAEFAEYRAQLIACTSPTPDPAHDTTGNGTESHYELAQQLEMRGYRVDPDEENNEHSYVRFGLSDEIIGDIHGDDTATVTNRK
jgi:hypothetical protein